MWHGTRIIRAGALQTDGITAAQFAPHSDDALVAFSSGSSRRFFFCSNSFNCTTSLDWLALWNAAAPACTLLLQPAVQVRFCRTLACARGADSSFMCRSPSRAQLPTDGAPVGAASCLLLHPLPSTPNLFSLVMRPVLPFLSCECFGCFKDSGQLLLPRKVCTYCTRCCSSIASCTVLADTPLQLSQQYCSVCSCDYDCYC